MARRIFPIVAGLFAACAVLQVFLAGMGVFDNPRSFIDHRNFGYMFGWLTLVLLVLAIAGRMGRRFVGGSVLLLTLFAFQSVFVALRGDLPAVAALHPLNGFGILGLALLTTWASWRVRHETATSAEGSAVVDTLGETPTTTRPIARNMQASYTTVMSRSAAQPETSRPSSAAPSSSGN